MAFNNYLKIALLLLAICLPSMAFAEDEVEEYYQSVTVVQTDGESYSLDLVNGMYGLFDDNADFVVRVPVLNEAGEPVYDESTGLLIEEDVLAIPGLSLQQAILKTEPGAVHGVDSACRISYDPVTAVLYVEGGENLAIFNLAGVNVDNLHLNAGEGRAEIPMRPYGAGVYVVKVESKTLKLFVK